MTSRLILAYSLIALLIAIAFAATYYLLRQRRTRHREVWGHGPRGR